MITLSTNWSQRHDTATATLETMTKLLDGRNKAVKEATPEQVERVLCSYLAYGENEFQVLLEKVPAPDKDLVRVATDSLVGEVLQRTSGRNCYKVKNGLNVGMKFESATPLPSAPRVETSYGAVYTDNNYHDVPVEQIAKLNYLPPSSVTVVKPRLQTDWLLKGSAPKRTWNEINEEELPELEMSVFYSKDLAEEMKEYIDLGELFKEIRDQAVASNDSLASYRDDTILCNNPTIATQALYIASMRALGKSHGFRYMLQTKSRLTGANGRAVIRNAVSHGFRDCRNS